MIFDLRDNRRMIFCLHYPKRKEEERHHQNRYLSRKPWHRDQIDPHDLSLSLSQQDKAIRHLYSPLLLTYAPHKNNLEIPKIPLEYNSPHQFLLCSRNRGSVWLEHGNWITMFGRDHTRTQPHSPSARTPEPLGVICTTGKLECSPHMTWASPSAQRTSQPGLYKAREVLALQRNHTSWGGDRRGVEFWFVHYKFDDLSWMTQYSLSRTLEDRTTEPHSLIGQPTVTR